MRRAEALRKLRIKQYYKDKAIYKIYKKLDEQGVYLPIY
jgi:hypothetical protein